MHPHPFLRHRPLYCFSMTTLSAEELHKKRATHVTHVTRVDAKAGCLYQNNARARFYADARGFDNAVVCDVLSNVAELAASNIFMAKNSIVYTPMPNGTFLAGITRQRVIGLLRVAGVTVIEKILTYQDLEAADEIFSTGNYSKVVPITRIDGHSFIPGRFTPRRANSIGRSHIQHRLYRCKPRFSRESRFRVPRTAGFVESRIRRNKNARSNFGIGAGKSVL